MRILITVLTTLLFHATSAVAQQPANETTPLGTQTQRPNQPPQGSRPNPPPQIPIESPTAVLQRALRAHGGENFKNVKDSISEGTLTLYSMDGPYARYTTTIWRDGLLVQRSIQSAHGELRQGTDGSRTWETTGGFVTVARGPALEFIEIHTLRDLTNIFEHQPRGSQLRDDGMRGNARVLTIEESNGRTTSYLVDETRSLVNGLELISGRQQDLMGSTVPVVQSYVFSNFRTIQGVATPFKVEHFTNGIKAAEFLLTSVRYNTGFDRSVFHP